MGDKFSPENRTLYSLRSALKQAQQEVAAVLGLKDGSLLSQFENGRKPLSYEYLEEMAAAYGVPPEGVEALLLAHRLLWDERGKREAGGPEPPPFDPTPAERWRMWRTAIAAAWTVAETLFAELARRHRAEKVKRTLREAEKGWELLKDVWRQEGRNLVLLYPRLRTPAFAARVCEASAQAAAHRVEDALGLAELALFIAGRVPGGEARRARTEGFCRAFLANALRVATEFAAAAAELARAWELFRASDPSEPEILPEWRLHDLEASLRRAQRRFPEALQCIERALALCGGRPAAMAHIFLKKEHIFNAMGDTQGALSTLKEAAPYVEVTGDPNQLFALRFNTADNLCSLGRYDEAAMHLGSAREIAIEMGKELHLIRVAWLTAKVVAGQGRIEEGIAGLEEVRQDFRAHNLPYEAALASLDLAEILLRDRRTAEVKELAFTLAWIFKAKGIAREALAALALFRDAARQEIATVELIREVIARIEEVRRSAPSGRSRERPRPTPD
jgi:transcriptional regulator with XRE-family HTH domain